MSDLATVEKDILAINEWTPIADLATLRDRLTFIVGKCAELKKLLEERMLAVIEETGEDIVIGPIRYYAGVKKDTKCNDNLKALDAMLSASGGDIAAVAACIASDGLKPGACKNLLGDKFGEYFTTIEKPELRDGKPKKSLLTTNDEFNRSK